MKNKPFNCLGFIAILYATTMSTSAILSNKIILSNLGEFSAASLISPFWFMLTDVIAEVYGYQISKKLFWSVIFCQFLFALTCFLIIKLPSPTSWNEQHSYDFVTGHLVKIAFYSLVGNIIAWKVNTFLLLKWKKLTQGKYFWLRSLGASSAGEIIFSILSVSLSILGMFPYSEVISIVLWSCLLKLIGIITLSPINNYLVTLINHDQEPIYSDYFIKFNPFKQK